MTLLGFFSPTKSWNRLWSFVWFMKLQVIVTCTRLVGSRHNLRRIRIEISPGVGGVDPLELLDDFELGSPVGKSPRLELELRPLVDLLWRGEAKWLVLLALRGSVEALFWRNDRPGKLERLPLLLGEEGMVMVLLLLGEGGNIECKRGEKTSNPCDGGSHMTQWVWWWCHIWSENRI